MIYLDNASTTQVDDEVLDAMLPFLKDSYGNAGALYELGRRSADAIAEARENVALLIGASPEQIIFTSGGTEANNMVFYGLADTLLTQDRNCIITTQIEHDSILNATKNMSNFACLPQKPCIKPVFDTVYIAPESTGNISYEKVLPLICENAQKLGLVSIMHTNNETGVINSHLRDIALACHSVGAFFHTDCVQALGCSKIDVNNLCCDFLSISSHKIHGCKGIGALYVKDIKTISPIIFGGKFQEFGLRGGTENVAGIVGFGKACEILNRDFENDVIYVTNLRCMLYNYLKEGLTRYGLGDIIHINGEIDLNEYGKTINIRFDNIDSETLLLILDAKGVCVSAGSACQSHESNPSHVLLAMGISAEDARSSIRFSFSKMNTEKEVKQAAQIIVECVSLLYNQFKTGGI